MRKSKTPMIDDFKIHEDSSCLADNSELSPIPSKRSDSESTVIHHDASDERDDFHSEDDTESSLSGRQDEAQRPKHDSHTEALIQAAARAVVASIEQHIDFEGYDGGNEDSMLSVRTRESLTSNESGEFDYPEGTDLAYGGDIESNLLLDQDEEEHVDDKHNSMNDTQSTEAYQPNVEVIHPGSGARDSQDEYAVDDEDVFIDKSGRSSLNPHDSVELCHHASNHHMSVAKRSPRGFADNDSDDRHRHPDNVSFSGETISRIPSTASFTIAALTPSRTHPRPPFRTPSSVRAIQMSSPTPSVFSSSSSPPPPLRSSRKPHPGGTGSRFGTPAAHAARSSVTPTRAAAGQTPTPRFAGPPLRPRAPAPAPLVLLHVTVLAPRWRYARALEAAAAAGAADAAPLRALRDGWRLLREKLGAVVLERGVLLAHPQDDIEVLQERLLAALELPVRPRALILRCGHYLGRASAPLLLSSPPSSPSSRGGGGGGAASRDASESDDYDDDGGGGGDGDSCGSASDSGVASWSSASERGQAAARARARPSSRWCDVCRREVRLDAAAASLLGRGGRRGERLFEVKVFASNGLMRAGAWQAAWREMERVDVEIEPYVRGGLVAELDRLEAELAETEALESRFEAEVCGAEEEAAAAAARAGDQPMRATGEEAEGGPHSSTPSSRILGEDEERLNRRSHSDEERMREIYGDYPQPDVTTSHSEEASMPPVDEGYEAARRTHLKDDSLPELMLKAFKVAMRDRRNVLICLLSVAVVLLALRPGAEGTSSFASPSLRQHGPIVTDAPRIESIPSETFVAAEASMTSLDEEAEPTSFVDIPLQAERADIEPEIEVSLEPLKSTISVSQDFSNVETVTEDPVALYAEYLNTEGASSGD